VTIKTFEDNALVRSVLENEQGKGRVLVIDGGGSVRCALIGGGYQHDFLPNPIFDRSIGHTCAQK